MELDKALNIIIESTRQAVHQLFDTMCPLPVVDGDVIPQASLEDLRGKFSSVGVIAITGECKGSVSIHVSKEFGERVAKVMLGLDTIESEADIYDTVGEVANIAVGGAKTIAASSSLSFDITCPTVIRGYPFATVEPARGSHYSLVNFMVDGHHLLIMVSLIQ